MSPLTARLPDIAASRHPRELLATLGEVFAAFEEQDSGCRSYGVAAGGERWFVKLAPDAATAALLRSAARFHAAVRHPVILAPVAFADADERAALVYPWVPGAVLYHATKAHRPSRTDPDSPMRAFRAQPLRVVRRVVDDIFDAHAAVAAAGYVAVDLYDGSMLYDPVACVMRLIDLDHYRPAPFTVGPKLLPGSRRFLSPEERTAGAVVDERTMVYTMGRTALILMDEGDLGQAWRGTQAQLRVLLQATRADPAGRHESVARLAAAWRAVSLRDGD
jgi:serine/threonine-protein kinase